MVCLVILPKKLLIILFEQNTPKNLTIFNNESLYKSQKFINAKLTFKLRSEVCQVRHFPYRRGFG
jgi:hypothetical protein